MLLKTGKLAARDLPTVWDLETTGGLSAGELCDRATITELSRDWVKTPSFKTAFAFVLASYRIYSIM
ncbi:hypothetical protein C7B69_18115 [filamentous cyanobacterium Phorm 46]|nr:hypothetical protein C7B69_18115 [filamentous cyanobacterium Phorm 46]PSB50885.1 hypothetical protein C7B67_12865 [filamentous cyanobacterium Phorm 6]